MMFTTYSKKDGTCKVPELDFSITFHPTLQSNQFSHTNKLYKGIVINCTHLWETDLLIDFVTFVLNIFLEHRCEIALKFSVLLYHLFRNIYIFGCT